MKHYKILIALLVIVTVLMSMTILTSYAADKDTVVYLSPNSNWKKDNAEFAVYVWIEGGDHRWIDMTDPDGDEIYEAAIPAGYTNLIFCRMNPNRAANGWSDGKMWNQTEDLTLPTNGDNLYKVASGTWSKGGGSWSVFDSNACSHSYDENDICTKCGDELFYIIAGNVMKNGEVYAEGDNSTLFVSKWDVADENNRMFYDSESGCYVKIYTGVAAGEYHFKIAEGKSWDVSYGKDGGNAYLKVEEDGSTVVIAFKDGNITTSSAVIPDPGEPEDDTDKPSDTPDNPEKPGNSEKPDDPGETPDDTPDKPDSPNTPDDSINENNPPKLNFFQKIWRAIANFFKRIFG